MPLVLAAYARYRHLQTRLVNIAVRRDFGGWEVGVQLHVPFRVEGAERIYLGKASSIGANSWLIAHPGAEIRTGRLLTSGETSLSAAAGITIGDNVLLARNVHVIDHLHGSGDPTIPIYVQGLEQIAPVEIRDGAWLGANVVVLPGVTIGRNARVGANSVVTKDVRDHATVVGAPAREV